MLNSVSLVGRIKKTTYKKDDHSYIDIEIKKPFATEIGLEEFDLYSIQLWKGLEDYLDNECFIDSLIAIRGRLCYLNKDQYVVKAEVVELLDKHFHK